MLWHHTCMRELTRTLDVLHEPHLTPHESYAQAMEEQQQTQAQREQAQIERQRVKQQQDEQLQGRWRKMSLHELIEETVARGGRIIKDEAGCG